MVRAACFFLALFCASGFAQEKVSKKQVSASGLYTIYEREPGDGSCLIIVLKDGAPHWQLSQCLAHVTTDLLFVSNDGDSFWVVNTLAEKKKGRVKKGQVAWGGAVVLKLYDREGKLLASRTAGSLVPKVSRPDVTELAKHVKWCEGTNGVRGRPPHVNDDNQLEVDAIGPRTWKLPFDERGETKETK